MLWQKYFDFPMKPPFFCYLLITSAVLFLLLSYYILCVLRKNQYFCSWYEMMPSLGLSQL